MNPLFMMAMAMSMSNRSNAVSTAQTVLGAADGLGQSGRLAVGLVRQRNEEQAQLLADRETGQQLVDLLVEHKITSVDLTRYPALKKAVDAAMPASSTGSGMVMGGAAANGTGVVALSSGNAVNQSAPGPMTHIDPHTPVDPKYALSVVSGNVQGSVRVEAAASAAAAQASADARAAVEASEAAQQAARAAADEASAAVAAAAAAPGDAGLASKAVEAKKKAEVTVAFAADLESKAHTARAVAHTAKHAVAELRAMLASWC
jgi:hypothetical protein